jgi:iron(III) transport system permease protein
LVPPQIAALSWIDLTGPSSTVLGPLGLAPAPGSPNWLFSREGIILLMGIEHSTMVFLALRAGLRSTPRDLIEAARAGGAGPLRITFAVILPLLRPSLLAGAALAFVASIGNFAIPAMLGIPGRYTTLTVLIYQRLNGFGPRILGEVATLGMILVLLAVVGLTLQALALRANRFSVNRDSLAESPFGLGRWRPLVETCLWLALFGIAIAPMAALVGTSLVKALGVPLTWETATFSHFATALNHAAVRRGFINSTWLAAGAALVSVAISLPFAYLVACRRRKDAAVLNFAADAPFALPGIVLSVAFILVFLKPLPLLEVSLYSTPWIILLAYLARFLVLGLRPTLSGVEQLEPALEEAARIGGARSLRRLVQIVTPLAAPAAAAGGLLIFMTAYNELTVSALLWSSGNETIGVMIYNLYSEGNSTAAAATSVLSILATFAVAGLATLVARRLPKGVLPWQG